MSRRKGMGSFFTSVGVATICHDGVDLAEADGLERLLRLVEALAQRAIGARRLSRSSRLFVLGALLHR